MIRHKYKAVNLQELKSTLRYNCSPSRNENSWYVIGPDINNRLCHCATCSCEVSAKRYAETLNKNLK